MRYKLDKTNMTNAVSSSRDVAYGLNGTYLAVASTFSPYLTIYKREGDVYTALTNPTTLPTGGAYGVSFSPDGTYLVVGHYNSPYITIYKRNGDTFTKLTNPSTLPTRDVISAKLSTDGIYLAVALFNDPFISIYKRNGDTFTKLANPSSVPVMGVVESVSFSPDNVHLVFGHQNSPYITIYKRSGDTFTKLANPSNLPIDRVYAIGFSPDGKLMTISSSNSIITYDRIGDSFTKRTDPEIMPTSRVNGIKYSSDGSHLYLAQSNPCLLIYRNDEGLLTRLPIPDDGLSGTSYGVDSLSINNTSIIAITLSTAPNVGVMKLGIEYENKLILLSNEKNYTIKAKQYIDKVPTMTSYEKGLVKISSSSEYNTATYPAWQAFNDTLSSSTDAWMTGTGKLAGEWIMVDLGEESIITRYSMAARNFSTTNFPSGWILQGSNDGVIFEDLDARVNLPAFTAGKKETYINNIKTGSYRFYRIYITATTGTHNYFGIGEIELLSPVYALIRFPNASEEKFISYGVEKEEYFDWKSYFNTLQDITSSSNSLGVGKLYEHSVDMKKYAVKSIKF